MSLAADLKRLSDAHAEQLLRLRALRVTIVEDRPLDRDFALIDGRADAVDALTGIAEDCCVAARRAADAGGSPIDWPNLERALFDCAQGHASLTERGWSELLRHDRVLQISSLARRHRGEWVAWAHGVFAGCDDCQRAVHAVGLALVQAFRALLEHSAGDPRGAAQPATLHPTSPLETTIKEEAHVID